MPLAFAASLDPTTQALMAGVLVGQRRPRNVYAKRDWLRVSQRLASGLTPAEVARAEGAEESAVTALLAQRGFKELVASYEAQLAEPPEVHTARLVKLARLALENALSDWDVGAALFVLEENARKRDPAQTLAQGVVAASRRKARSGSAPSPPAEPAAVPAAPRPYDPLAGLMQRGAASLRRAMVEEQATRLAVATSPEPDAGKAATIAAAREALALKSARPPDADQTAAALARRLAAGVALGPAPYEPPAPRRPRPAGRPRAP